MNAFAALLKRDLRIAMRVGGVQGPSALGGSTDHQDFTLINHSAFAFADSRPFAGLVEAASGGAPALLAWALSWDKFDAMASKQPRLALDLVKGLAGVLAVRMREAILVGQFT